MLGYVEERIDLPKLVNKISGVPRMLGEVWEKDIYLMLKFHAPTLSKNIRA